VNPEARRRGCADAQRSGAVERWSGGAVRRVESSTSRNAGNVRVRAALSPRRASEVETAPEKRSLENRRSFPEAFAKTTTRTSPKVSSPRLRGCENSISLQPVILSVSTLPRNATEEQNASLDHPSSGFATFSPPAGRRATIGVFRKIHVGPRKGHVCCPSPRRSGEKVPKADEGLS